MSIIATVGRRSWGTGTLIASMYLLLVVGGLSMVYPFLLMLSAATTTPGDMPEYRIVPAYFHDDNALYRKFVWLRYDNGTAGGAAAAYNLAYRGARVSNFRRDEFFGWGDPDNPADAGRAIPPHLAPADPAVRRRAADLDRFLHESAALWPGPPLTRAVTRNADAGGTRFVASTSSSGHNGARPSRVPDPGGQPLDPADLSSGLGNRYRTVGYIGAAYLGFRGPGRREWTTFLEQLYGDPGAAGLARLIQRHGRPYKRFEQVPPGYDLPNSSNWTRLEGDCHQAEWLAYKSLWLSGAPTRAITGEHNRIEAYADVLGRTADWTSPRGLRLLRPTQVMPLLWADLRNRYLQIEQFNLAIRLARRERIGGVETIRPTRRDMVAVQAPASGPGPSQAVVGYLPPPRLNPGWSVLTAAVGLERADIERLNERIESGWVAFFRSAPADTSRIRIVHLPPFQSFEDIYVPANRPIYEPLAEQWDQFVAKRVPPEMAGQDELRLPCHAWRQFLGWLYDAGDPWQQAAKRREFRRLYLGGRSDADIARSVEEGRALYGPRFDELDLAAMPIAERDLVEFHDHKSELRRHFLFGNFVAVWNELVVQGRAMFNTIVLILLAIVTSITVNPLAAYALSRFRLAYAYKVLLFLLATMAFPTAVGMIPGFLLLKHFGLINTYAALVLPGVASGYTIFLLKGFFDALPTELYEAAEIDGAGKIATFLNVTFPLSKPIFAIITLGAFTAAYSGFMWAFLICPDSRMWTIMVHLFNVQQNSTAPIAMAALVIAAIPTLVVFLFCQNVILKGIIVPSFK